MPFNWLRRTSLMLSTLQQKPRRRRVSASIVKTEIMECRLLLTTVTTVTTLADSGAGSLRDAIAQTPSGGTINFAQGLSGTITLTSGELLITNSVSIVGPGSGQIAISGNNSSRVFDVPSTGTSLSISGLTIENGNTTPGAAITSGWGGGIESYGSLTVTNCVLSGNFASYGGGAINEWGATTITGSTFTNNTTTPSLGGGGGAIYFSRANANISGSSFTGNSGQQGGAVINNSGSLTIDSSSFTSNVGGTGGAVFNVFGTGTITKSTFTNNNATISAGFDGGAISNSGGATLTIDGCTLNGNTAGTGTGGGVYNQDSTLTISNSTLTGNSAHSGGAIDNVYSTSATSLTVNNSTISGNTATIGGGVFNYAFGGAAPLGKLNSFDTIIAGNSATSGSADVSGAITSLGHNLIGNGTGGSGYVSSDLVGTAANVINPQLGPLQNNGGSTQTMALLPGSPAINAGDNTNAPQFDQRGSGFARVVGGTIDIGAFEVQNPVTQLAPTVVVNPINLTYGTALADSQLTGSATAVINGQTVTVPGAFKFTSAAGVILTAGAGQTEQVTFTPTDTVTYSSVQSSVIVNVNQANPTVNWASPSSITYGTALSATQLNATSNVAGTFAYTPASGSVLPAGSQTLSVTFTPTDTVDYTSTTVTVPLQVGQASAAFSNLSAPTIVIGTPSTTISGQIGSGNAAPVGDSVTVTLNGSSQTAVVGTNGQFTVSLPTATLALGIHPISFQFAGDSNFTSATATSNLTVTSKQAIVASGDNFSAIAGAPVTTTVAQFTNIDPARSASSYLTAIIWGDGTSTAGVVSGSGATLTVTGTHTYAAAGKYKVQVLIVDSLGVASSALTAATATVKSLKVEAEELRGLEFWTSASGKALIQSFNGGATQGNLASWLVSSFPNIFGTGANNLTGKTNSDVVSLLQNNSKNLLGEVLVVALDIYASTTSLGGAQGAHAGFANTATGLGAELIDVGKFGAAFGVKNDKNLNVYQLLSSINGQSLNDQVYQGNTRLTALATSFLTSLLS